MLISDVQHKVLKPPANNADEDNAMELADTLNQQLNNQFKQVAAIAPHDRKIKSEDQARGHNREVRTATTFCFE